MGVYETNFQKLNVLPLVGRREINNNYERLKPVISVVIRFFKGVDVNKNLFSMTKVEFRVQLREEIARSAKKNPLWAPIGLSCSSSKDK